MDIIVCIWILKKWLFIILEGKVLIWVYIGKLGDIVVDDYIDEEIVLIVRKDLS